MHSTGWLPYRQTVVPLHTGVVNGVRLWMRRVAEAAAFTAVASAIAITGLWLIGDRPHLPGVIVPPTAIFLTMLATSSLRERGRREKRKRAGDAFPPGQP